MFSPHLVLRCFNYIFGKNFVLLFKVLIKRNSFEFHIYTLIAYQSKEADERYYLFTKKSVGKGE